MTPPPKRFTATLFCLPLIARELVDVLWAHGKLRHSPCPELERGVLEPLLQRGVPFPLSQASSVELAKIAAAFSMMRRKDRCGL